LHKSIRDKFITAPSELTIEPRGESTNSVTDAEASDPFRGNRTRNLITCRQVDSYNRRTSAISVNINPKQSAARAKYEKEHAMNPISMTN